MSSYLCLILFSPCSRTRMTTPKHYKILRNSQKKYREPPQSNYMIWVRFQRVYPQQKKRFKWVFILDPSYPINMAKRCSKYNHHGATYRFSWVQTEGQSVLPAHIHHQAAAMRPLQRSRKCSTLCHEGRRLKIGCPRIVAPLCGISAEQDDFVMGLLAIFMDREIMEQKPLEFNLCLEKTIEIHGVRTGHPAVRVGFLLDITSHRQGDEATPLTSTCWAAWHPKSLLWNTYEAVSENGVYIYIYMMVYIYIYMMVYIYIYMMVYIYIWWYIYIYDGIPVYAKKKKTSMFMGRIWWYTEKKKQLDSGAQYLHIYIL